MLMKATFEAAAARGYAVFVESAGWQPSDERQAASSLFRSAFDGVIFHPSHVTPTKLTDLAERQPVLPVGENPEQMSLDWVSNDNAQAADQLTSHLVAGGRRTIAFLGTRAGSSQPSGLRLRD
jgi:DNA-binding LacI/PurR family transcriptional regulator